jgi:hypothetical protein
MAPHTAPWNATTVLTGPVSISLLWEPFPDSLWLDYPRGYRITFQRVALGGIRTSGDDVTVARVDYKTGSYPWTNLQYYTKYKIEISTITYRGYGPKVIVYAGKNQGYFTVLFKLLRNQFYLILFGWTSEGAWTL